MYNLVIEALCGLWGVATSVLGTGSNIALAIELQAHIVMWLFGALLVSIVVGIFRVFANLF
jgi:hypothetical protein